MRTMVSYELATYTNDYLNHARRAYNNNIVLYYTSIICMHNIILVDNALYSQTYYIIDIPNICFVSHIKFNIIFHWIDVRNNRNGLFCLFFRRLYYYKYEYYPISTQWPVPSRYRLPVLVNKPTLKNGVH